MMKRKLKLHRRYAGPGDYCRPLLMALTRSEVILLHFELIERIESNSKKGESIDSLNQLAEKIERALRPGDMKKY